MPSSLAAAGSGVVRLRSTTPHPDLLADRVREVALVHEAEVDEHLTDPAAGRRLLGERLVQRDRRDNLVAHQQAVESTPNYPELARRREAERSGLMHPLPAGLEQPERRRPLRRLDRA